MHPKPDQIEVTLIGPGYGESIVIHIGDGLWLCVDSCVGKDGTSLPLNYLKSIGVDVGSAVKLVTASHWHDDHVRGISNVLCECQLADFCFPGVLTREEFVVQVSALSNSFISASGSGVTEANAILQQMQSERKVGATRRYFRASRNKRIQRWGGEEFSHGYDCEVWCLSPSDAEFDLFLTQLAPFFPEIKKPLRRLPSLCPNNTSVVLWIRIGPVVILLGGDLEETGLPGCGWTDIANDPNRPGGQAHIFKIPHHGSENAHSDLAWKQLLIENPDSCLTPYARGRRPRPSKDDVARILKLSDRAVSSARMGSRKPLKRDPVVERQIRDMGVKLRSTQIMPGRVTYRNDGCRDFEMWTFSLHDGATNLSQLHN